MTASWKTVRAFISSTFRDMHAERDHLIRFVFPRLREHLLTRRIHLVDVDLRWGVTSEQDAAEVCREIINECHPRFLCILGGRYGWVPPGKNRSITADEVHFGVLDRALTERGFAYFYFRDDAATSAMVETTTGEFREPHGSVNQSKLVELKQAIVAEKLNPFTYPAQWDNESRRLTSLRQFGDRVYDDLLDSMKSDPELRDRFEADTAAQLDEFAEENVAMEAFVEERSERFVLGSREPVLNELLAHASATSGNGYLCLTGAAGSGKSALLAYLSPHSTFNNQPATILIRHFVGASPGSTDVRRTLRRLCHELKATSPAITADIPDDPEKLRVGFPDFLRQACARQRVVILLDAVNQFDPTSGLSGSYWLPDVLPDNARIILSAVDGPALDELRRRPDKPREIELQPLTADDGEAIIEQFRRRYRKTLEPDQRAALLAKTDAGTPLYLLAALEELRTLGTYEEITQRITELPPTTHELFAWILERLENDDGFRDASGQRVGHDLVSRFAAMLAASRYGLSQRELADLLDAGDPQGNVAALLHLLRPYLMRRGELLDFYHGHFRAAIENHYLANDEARRLVHGRLADYFARQGLTVRKVDELPWQFAQSESWLLLCKTLTDLPLLTAIYERNQYDIRRYWTLLERKSAYRILDEYREFIDNPAQNFPRSDAKQSIDNLWSLACLLEHLQKEEEAFKLFRHLAIECHATGDKKKLVACLGRLAVLRGGISLVEALTLYEKQEQLARSIDDYRGLQEALRGRAMMHGMKGELDKEMEVNRERQRLCRAASDWYGLQNVLGEQACVLHRIGKIEEALKLHDEEERICRNIGQLEELAECLENQVVCLGEQKRIAEAETKCREAENIYREIGHKRGILRCLLKHVWLLTYKGSHSAALALLNECEPLAKELGDPGTLADYMIRKGALLCHLDRQDEAVQLAEEAYDLASKHDLAQTAREAMALTWDCVKAESDDKSES